MKARAAITIKTAPCFSPRFWVVMSPLLSVRSRVIYALQHVHRAPKCTGRRAGRLRWLLGPDVHALGLELVGLPLPAGAGEGGAPPGDLHGHEARLLDRVEVLSLQESAPDSGGPDGDVLPARGRDVLVDHDVGDLEAPARLEHPEGLGEDPVLLGGEGD